jgi:hypothetical protein
MHSQSTAGFCFYEAVMRPLDETPIYYVYEHYKPNCDEPFYVGKGHLDRAYSNYCRNPWWQNIVNKHGREVRFVAENLSEIDAFWLENMCIKGWGRADLGEGPLVNMTDGGEGQCGTARSKKWRTHRSNLMKGNTIKVGKPNGPEAIAIQRKKVTGRHHTDETKQLQRDQALKRDKFIMIVNIKTNVGSSIKKGEKIPKGWRRGMSSNNIWVATNIETNVTITGTIEYISKIIKKTTTAIYKACSKKYNTGGYKIDKLPFRKIKTPLGLFSSLVEASKKTGYQISTIARKCKIKNSGYEIQKYV